MAGRDLGQYSMLNKNVVFPRGKDENKFLAAVEIHEAVHNQLANISHTGALVNYLQTYKGFVTQPEHISFLNLVIQFIEEEQLYVHESIATTCMVIYLIIEDKKYTDYKRFLNSEYQSYVFNKVQQLAKN